MSWPNTRASNNCDNFLPSKMYITCRTFCRFTSSAIPCRFLKSTFPQYTHSCNETSFSGYFRNRTTPDAKTQLSLINSARLVRKVMRPKLLNLLEPKQKRNSSPCRAPLLLQFVPLLLVINKPREILRYLFNLTYNNRHLTPPPSHTYTLLFRSCSSHGRLFHIPDLHCFHQHLSCLQTLPRRLPVIPRLLK